MNVCFVVPDGTGIRNYLFSDLLQHLNTKGAKIWIWHTLTSGAIEEIRRIHPNIEIQEQLLPAYSEKLYEKFLRESIAYARLLHNAIEVNNETILVNWRKNPKKTVQKLFYAAAKVYGKYLSRSYSRILNADKKYLNSVNTSSQLNKYEMFLKEINADCVICTHQRAVTAIPAMQAANQNDIETISAIYSWDNMPKARLNTRSQKYIVWSQYMKNEMEIYYPEIDLNTVIVTGTPQFEFYFHKSFLINKEAFFGKYGLDINKKTICYSGDDSLTSPYDPTYLAELAATIKTTQLKDKVQILLRRAPVDLSGRFDAVVAEFSDVIKVANPIWNFDSDDTHNWTLVYPSMDDVQLLINTAYHCDLVYNVGSTMAHDFAMFNKPAAYINYDVAEATNWTTNIIYKYQHFRTQKELEAVVWINAKAEIYEKLTEVLMKGQVLAPDNVSWLNVISEYRDSASENIASIILGDK